jgi:NAD(P)-dependent dehydrogenase (short-subunit alcohol dehydrogenase family)
MRTSRMPTQTALIVGASRGLGLAREYLRRRWNVAATVRGPPQQLEDDRGDAPHGSVPGQRAGWFMENAAWDVEPAKAGVIPTFLQPVDDAIRWLPRPIPAARPRNSCATGGAGFA